MNESPDFAPIFNLPANEVWSWNLTSCLNTTVLAANAEGVVAIRIAIESLPPDHKFFTTTRCIFCTHIEQTVAIKGSNQIDEKILKEKRTASSMIMMMLFSSKREIILSSTKKF